VTASDPAACARLYETLARFAWWRRRWQRCAPGAGLEMRKRLLPPHGDGPADGGAGFDAWLRALLPEHRGARVLDVGCGFGASLLRWLEAGAASGRGVTASGFQANVAAAEAKRRGLGERAAFAVHDFAAAHGGPFHVAIAIEALGHAQDLGAVLASVRRALAPGGHFVWVEDLLQQTAPGDAEVAELARRWSSPPLRDVGQARRLLGDAGLAVVREVDLTAQVDVAPPGRLHEIERRLHAWRALLPLPPARRLLDAFLGGLALERLYARGLACYRVWVLRRAPEMP